RHDLGRVAAPGTVTVPDLMLVERYSHVMHLVSEVQATARADLTMPELLAATFPGGTITGAPKQRVMEAIAALEPGPRGWYTGAVGIVGGRVVDLNILIRTAAFTRTPAGWDVEVRAGGGTVIDADPVREAQETVHKAQALLSVLAGVPGRPARPPAPPVVGRAWAPPPVTALPGGRVLLLDNRDSFTWNLAHDLLALGAQVDVRSHHEDVEALLATHPDAVLVGPGPGTPDTSGHTLELTRRCLHAGVPLLGVCLGHQALGQVLGGRVERAAPVHGRPEAVQHDGTGLFTGVPTGAPFGRYHSLVVRGLPQGVVTATSADGEIMAIQVPGCPAWGVQFHPESVLSPAGRMLLGNWLRLSAQIRP
ncbi:glutamine amidotransferase-related protein, partial [Deinococcus sp.]|uniref:glutamine amidotransferase-related protein n=1 Tax=Deinococcus sp. TaxID=47478 RepID=UPI002869E147